MVQRPIRWCARCYIPKWYSNSLRFNGYNNAEAARLDSSGNLLVGRTSSSGVDTDGHDLFNSGESYQSVTSNALQFINRNGTDGNLLQLYKSGTHKGN